jgi:hypothetical protein
MAPRSWPFAFRRTHAALPEYSPVSSDWLSSAVATNMADEESRGASTAIGVIDK